ncbi:MAG TPA: caspase family protein, partial [Thermotogota bacterium]|nr:caspase family protein [Thermotogota bacterium]
MKIRSILLVIALLSVMLFFSSCAFMGWGVITEVSGERPASGKHRAVLVGVNDYLGEENDLNYCVNDALDLQTVLGNLKEAYEIQTVLDYVPSAEPQSVLASLSSSTAPEDVLVFSFSGHGFFEGESHLVFSDVTTFSVSQLRTMLDAIPGTKVVFIDACMSGSFVDLGASRETQQVFLDNILEEFSRPSPRGDSAYYVMAACRSDEYSMEFALIANGFFTFSLADGLGHVGYSNPNGSFDGTYNADSQGDGKITFRELV